jgi:hypothetical protein
MAPVGKDMPRITDFLIASISMERYNASRTRTSAWVFTLDIAVLEFGILYIHRDVDRTVFVTVQDVDLFA